MSALPKDGPRIFEPPPAPRRRAYSLVATRTPPTPGEVMTSGRIANLLRCSSRTVSCWIDRGQLRGYRLPGPKADRRVHAADFVEFLLAHGMLRELAVCLVADGGELLAARVHDRWGSPVARVAPAVGPAGSGVDWLPGEPSRYTLKSATPGAFRVLVDSGFRFEDGR